MEETIKRYSIKPIIQDKVITQIEVFIQTRVSLFGLLSTLDVSPQKKYMIISHKFYEKITPEIKRKFNEIIVIDPHQV